MRRLALIGLTMLALTGALAVAIKYPDSAHASAVLAIFLIWLWRR